MKQNNETIYLESDEEITFIIDRLRESKARKITLVVPKMAKLFQSSVNLKILKEQAEKLKKDIAVITTDKAGKNMAGKAGLVVHREMELSDNLLEKDEMGNKADETNKTDNEINGGQKVSAAKPAADVGGIKAGYEDNVVHLENKEFQNQEEEISKSGEKEIGRTKMFGAVGKENDFDEDSGSKTDFPPFGDSEKKFSLFPESLAKKRTSSLLPTLSAKFFTAFIFACLAVSAVAASFILPEAKVDIFLKTERVANNFEFAVDKNIIEPDVQLNKLPANTVEVVSKESSEFSATGKKRLSEKASGVITVYNEYTTSPQSLISNTRFLSNNGKTFRIKKGIIIPGFTKPEDEIIPGSLEIEVFAEEAGESYNIEPSSFTIPAFQEMGSPKYSNIYARSTAAMSGGSTKEVSVITETDISKAKDILLESLKNKNAAGIENEINGNDKLINGDREDEIAAVGLSNEAGDQVEKAIITIELSSKILTVRQNDIDKLVSHNFDAELSDKMELIPESKKTECGDSYLDADKNIIFPVYVEQEAVRMVDADQIKRNIIGKDEPELRTFFSEMEGIETVNISFWPFWVKNAPQSVKKISIEVK